MRANPFKPLRERTPPYPIARESALSPLAPRRHICDTQSPFLPPYLGIPAKQATPFQHWAIAPYGYCTRVPFKLIT